MSDFATSLAAARPKGPKGEPKSSVVPEVAGFTGMGWQSLILPPERELNDAWRGRQRTETVEDMLNHWQIAALVQAVRLPVHRYIIELDPQDCDVAMADHVGDDLDVPLVGSDQRRTGRRAKRFSARRHLDRALDAPLGYGHAVFEQVGRIEDSTGLWRLTDLRPVPQWTIDDAMSWEIDRHGRLVRVVQWAPTPPVKLDVDHLVVFTWQGRAGDPRGQSMLRPLTFPWIQSFRTAKVMGMSSERTGMGIPVGKVPPGAAQAVKDQMQRLLAGLAAGHDTNLILETDQDLALMGVTGSTPDLVERLRYFDEAMARGMLAMVMQLGQTSTGSRALGDTFDDLLADFHDALMNWYCDVMTEQLVEPWVNRNLGEDAPAPRLVWRRREDEPPAEAPAPVVIDSTAEEVDEPAQLPAPVSARRTTASRERRPMSAASTGNTGVMVALYPPRSVAEALALDDGEPADELHLTLAFLGKADDLNAPDALHAAVRVWASSTKAITGEVSGVGLFTAGDEPVTYLSLDAPALPQARQALIEALTAAGLTPSEQHGVTPHITIDYADRVADVDAGGAMLTFTAASVVIGDERTDYHLGTAEPVSATLERRQRAMRASFATTTGRDLRRDPFEHELAAATDFATIEAQFVATREAVAASLIAIRDELTARAVEEVAAQPVVDPLTLGDLLAPVLEEHAQEMDSAPLVALLVAFAVAGVHQVIGEAARQGVGLEAGIDYSSRAQTDAADLMRRMARQVADSAASAARAGLPADAQGQVAANVVGEHLGSLTSAAAEQAAAGATSRAQNAGRAAAFEAAPAAQYFASEVLDQSTCDMCLLVDGREYAELWMALDEYPAGGFVACEGMERCRGLVVGVFDSALGA